MKQLIFKTVCLYLCALYAVSTMAQTEVAIDGLKYQLSGPEAYVSGYVGSPTNVVIPATIESGGLTFKVTKINSKAFYDSNITTVTSEGNNLTTIDEEAFHNCYSLLSALFPSVRTINKAAFTYCNSMTSIYIPNVLTIGELSFQWCFSLNMVSLPSVETIEGGAFSTCTNLQKVILGPNVKTIGLESFNYCTSLSYIVIPAECSTNKTAFRKCDRLQAIIYLGTQTEKGSSNADIYNINNIVNWTNNTFPYSGQAPAATFTSNLPMGFKPINGGIVSDLEGNAGSYMATVPITFSNNDQEFTLNAPYSYTITPLKLTARVKDATREYGEPNPQFQAEYTGFISGEDASVFTKEGSFTTTATQTSNIGTYEIKLQGTVAQNYTFQYESGTLTVTKAPLTITPRDKMMEYGSRVPNLDVDYAGLKNNESKPAWISEPSITTTAMQESPAGSYPIIVNGGEAKNYVLTRKQGTLTISKASLTAITNNTSREYGEENPNFGLSYSGLKNGETAPEWDVAPSFVTAADKTSPVGTYTITATGGIARNYMVQYNNSGKLTVTKSILTAKARSYTKYQGSSNPKLEIDYTGFKNSDTRMVLEQEPIATTTCTLNSQAGTYPITVSGGLAVNYDFAYVNGTLTVIQNGDVSPTSTNVLSMSNVNSNKGVTVVLPIALTNENAITGIQADLYLPNGVTVATKSNGKLLIETTNRMDGSYSITGNNIENFIRIVGYSADGDSFSGNNGNILNITLNISEDLLDGDYTIYLRNIVLSDVNNTEYRPNDIEATITILSYTLGDVDRSGEININDVVWIINHILHKAYIPTMAGAFAADIDGNGTININDVVMLINRFILKKSNAPSLRAHVTNRASIVDDNYLHLADIEIQPGETLEIPLLMTNTDIVAAVQGNIKLPTGLTFVTKSNGRLDVNNNNTRSEDFTISCALQEDGSMTFTQYSSDGFTYQGTNGGIFTFKIRAAENIAAGIYDINLSEVVLSIGGVGYNLPNRYSSLVVKVSDGINSIKDNNKVDAVYTIGGIRNYNSLNGVKVVRMHDGTIKKVITK